MSAVYGQGPSAPAPDDNALESAIRSLLPERSAEDRAHGEIRVTFGIGEQAATLLIPVLFARSNREWQARFNELGRKVFTDLESDDTGKTVISLLTGATDLQLDLLAAYNPEWLGREYVETHATEEQILDAFLGVTAAAFPFPVKLARVLLGNKEVGRWVRLQVVRLLYSSSMSSSPPSTGGAPKKSKTPSPTNKSSA